MYGEYGYMEEGKLGKPYNFRLLKRLAPYATPYRKTILKALTLSILITLFDLAAPYLSKIAIDQYILSSWYRMQLSRAAELGGQDILTRYSHLIQKTRDGTSGFISHTNIRNIDPADLNTPQANQILTSEKFYEVGPDGNIVAKLQQSGKAAFTLSDGTVLIPYALLYTLPKDDVAAIRAQDIRGVTWVGALFLCILALSFGLSYAEYYLLEFTGQHMMNDIRLTLFETMQSQAIRFFERHPVGRLVTRVTNDIENLNEMFKSVLVTLLKDVFLLTGILVVLLYLNLRLALITFALLPFIFGLTFLFSSLAREAFRELRAAVAKINAFLQERFTGMRVIQLFAREKFQMDAFARINHENYEAGMRQIRVFAVFMPVMELIASFAVALLIWYGGGRVIQEQLSLGSLVAFISYIRMFFKPIRDISEKYNVMQSAMASTERIFEFMDHKEVVPQPAHPSTPADIKGHLAMDKVSFAYKKDNPVLHDISIEVKPGQTVAIVGATGSGKTTLVNLLERFYDPDKGAVFLDGIDLKKWPKKVLRANMGLCMQDVFIFSGSLLDNISLGRKDLSPEAVEQAAINANVLPFIKRLENGFLHEIGEGGGTISAGERQLLSFARALAANPRVLILDEATSSIDPETEHYIQEAISRMSAKRTTLIVAHRLSTIRDADQILVMHKGRLREQGTHEELMALGGIYYRLNKLREG